MARRYFSMIGKTEENKADPHNNDDITHSKLKQSIVTVTDDQNENSENIERLGVIQEYDVEEEYKDCAVEAVEYFHNYGKNLNNFVLRDIAPQFETARKTIQDEESPKSRWKYLIKKASNKKKYSNANSAENLNKSNQKDEKENLKNLQEIYGSIEIFSPEQIDILARHCYGNIPSSVTLAEKMESVIAYKKGLYKKDSRQWLHKSSKKKKNRKRVDIANAEYRYHSGVTAINTMGTENFEYLLSKPPKVASRGSLDRLPSNSNSDFDMMNLGPYYEEAQRQKAMIFAADKGTPPPYQPTPYLKTKKEKDLTFSYRMKDSESLPDVDMYKDAKINDKNLRNRTSDIPLAVYEEDCAKESFQIRRSLSDSIITKGSRASDIEIETEYTDYTRTLAIDSVENLRLPTPPSDSDSASRCSCTSCSNKCMTLSREPSVTSIRDVCMETNNRFVDCNPCVQNYMGPAYEYNRSLHNQSPVDSIDWDDLHESHGLKERNLAKTKRYRLSRLAHSVSSSSSSSYESLPSP